MTEIATEIDTANTRSPKGAQARARIKRAALVVLERVGYHRMRIADVAKEAGVAQGLFYHYFADLKTMTLEVLGEYVAQAGRVEKIEENAEPGNWYQLIYAHNHLVVSSYAQRPGLMRCLFQLADEEEEFARMLRESFLEQMNWLVKLMPGLFPDTTFARHQALMIAYSLAGAGETLLKEYFVNANPALTAAKLSTDDITELLSTMFYRALFLEHPADKELSYTRNLSTMTKKQMSTKA